MSGAAEEEVRQFLQFAEVFPEAMLLVSGDGVVRAVNRAAATKLGLVDLAGRPLAEIAADPPETLAVYLRECARSRQMLPGALSLDEGGRRVHYRVEGAVIRPRQEGEPALILLRLVSKEEKVQRFLLLNQRIEELNREIVRRQEFEASLRQQREWLQVTIQSIGDAVIATDELGRILLMNPVAEELTGWSAAEARGRELSEVFHIVDEDTRKPVESPVEKVLALGTLQGLANHTVLISRQGRELPIDDCAAPIRDGGDQLRGVVMVFHDISERRRMEQELTRRAERLADAARRKDEFLAMLAHELRNPMAPIRNSLYLLGMPNASPDRVERARTIMERQVRNLARLVDDLLDVSRITHGKVQLQLETVDLTAIAARVAEAIQPLMEERGLRFAVSLAPGPLTLRADPTRLEQVLTNLLNNATKFTEAGGTVELSVARTESQAVLTVHDTGEGIPPDLLPDIFEPFTQASRSLDRSQGGLGIGLTLVRSLVELHGGTVSAASEGSGRGSEFVVRLPLG